MLHWFNSTVPAGRRGEGKEVCTLGLSYCMAGNKSQISLENSHTVHIFHVLSPMSTFLDVRATLQPTKGVTAGQIWATEQIFHGLPCRFQWALLSVQLVAQGMVTFAQLSLMRLLGLAVLC